jgi:predicted GIY-YIG superfamily endonuclease
MFHYTYIILDFDDKIRYLGCRSSKIEPRLDQYMSSSKFLNRNHKLRKRVLQVFSSRKEALEHEIWMHEKYKVSESSRYINRSRQTSTKFNWQGQHHSEETKIKCAPPIHPKGMLGKTHPRKGKTLLQEYGKERSDEIRQKISARHYNSEENHAWFGKHHSEETKKKISEININKPSWNKGKHHSEETKKKLSISKTGNRNSKFAFNVYDNNGNKFVVENCGIANWFLDVFGVNFPNGLKNSVKTGLPVQRGKYKGWRIEKYDRNTNKVN